MCKICKAKSVRSAPPAAHYSYAKEAQRRRGKWRPIKQPDEWWSESAAELLVFRPCPWMNGAGYSARQQMAVTGKLYEMLLAFGS